jgi:putative spermidine/putrescine transport system substrate-binding protein
VALAPAMPVAMPVVWAIPRGAPNADVALDFIAYTLGARPQAAFAAAGYTPAVPPPAATATATPTPARPTIPLNLQWWHDHGRDARARFAVWVNG